MRLGTKEQQNHRKKEAYDKGLKPTQFNVGVYVRVFDATVEAKQPVKFRNQYIGPFRVRGRKGYLWELEDLKGAGVKGLFYASKLKLVNEEGAHVEQNKSDSVLEIRVTDSLLLFILSCPTLGVFTQYIPH